MPGSISSNCRAGPRSKGFVRERTDRGRLLRQDRDNSPGAAARVLHPLERGKAMNSIIYIVGLVVVVLFILSFFGLR